MALHIAIKNNNTKLLASLLKDSTEFIEKPNKKGHSPLYHAIIKGNVDMVKLLIEHKADVNNKYQGIITPLNIAIYTENVKIVEQLIEYKVDINEPHPIGITPLIQAIDQGSLDIIQLLLDNGAEVNKSDRFGCSPINHALIMKLGNTKINLKMIRLLLDYGADPLFYPAIYEVVAKDPPLFLL